MFSSSVYNISRLYNIYMIDKDYCEDCIVLVWTKTKKKKPKQSLYYILYCPFYHTRDTTTSVLHTTYIGFSSSTHLQHTTYNIDTLGKRPHGFTQNGIRYLYDYSVEKKKKCLKERKCTPKPLKKKVLRVC